MSEQEVNALPAKTAKAASKVQFELLKTSSNYASAAQKPEMLGEERLKSLMNPVQVQCARLRGRL